MSLEALLTAAAFAPIENLGWLRITGEDRVRWLNGMTTNNIAALTPGQGCYTFFLNAQGRIQADATAWATYDNVCLDLQTSADRLPALAEMLERFIIMDDVELRQLDPSYGLLLAGPQAESVLSYLGFAAPGPMHEFQVQTSFYDSTVELMHTYNPLVPRYELWSDEQTRTKLCELLAAEGLSQASQADLEQLRILSGTPLYGTDIRNTEAHKDLPQETAQTRALHFAKGCYLGQEIVERIRSRGAVHRTFTGFTLTPTQPGAPGSAGSIADPGVTPSPPPGTMLFAPDSPEKSVGELTSVARTPFGLFALGYVRREVLDQGKSIQYSGGIAIPSPLPFAIPDLKRA